ncbi:MAG: Hpt domain-containing protein [Gammaproteobacteria bacterium]|nr:Hpt domain-containing protein [Gammaproteobacteria bacterium]
MTWGRYMEGESELLAAVKGLDPTVQQMLAEDLPIQLGAAKTAFAANDSQAAIDAVHGLAGTAAFCKFPALKEVADATESDLHAGTSPAALADSLHALERSVTDILDLLSGNSHD